MARQRLPASDDTPPEDWHLEAYAAFLRRHGRVSLTIEVWEALRAGPETRAVGPLRTVAISPRVRTYLRAHLRTGAFVPDGPGTLFAAVAQLELWVQLGWWGWLRYYRQRPLWQAARAEQLTRLWLQRRGSGERKIPPAPPGTVEGD